MGTTSELLGQIAHGDTRAPESLATGCAGLTALVMWYALAAGGTGAVRAAVQRRR